MAIDQKKLATLEFLSGQLETMAEFNNEYERLLKAVMALPDRKQKQDMAKAMQKILFQQSIFLMNKHIKMQRGLHSKSEIGNLQ